MTIAYNICYAVLLFISTLSCKFNFTDNVIELQSKKIYVDQNGQYYLKVKLTKERIRLRDCEDYKDFIKYSINIEDLETIKEELKDTVIRLPDQTDQEYDLFIAQYILDNFYGNTLKVAEIYSDDEEETLRINLFIQCYVKNGNDISLAPFGRLPGGMTEEQAIDCIGNGFNAKPIISITRRIERHKLDIIGYIMCLHESKNVITTRLCKYYEELIEKSDIIHEAIKKKLDKVVKQAIEISDLAPELSAEEPISDSKFGFICEKDFREQGKLQFIYFVGSVFGNFVDMFTFDEEVYTFQQGDFIMLRPKLYSSKRPTNECAFIAAFSAFLYTLKQPLTSINKLSSFYIDFQTTS